MTEVRKALTTALDEKTVVLDEKAMVELELANVSVQLEQVCLFSFSMLDRHPIFNNLSR